MDKEYPLGRIAGLRLSAGLLFVAGTLILWIGLSIIGTAGFDLPLPQAVAGGLAATFLYWLSEVIHQLGHAFAAHRTGHPMTGIRLGTYLVFSTSLYPENEGILPAGVHIRRALGGPIASFILTAAAGMLALLVPLEQGLPGWLVRFVCLVNLFVFALGAFLPLGFTDGSTLLKWWGKP